MNKISKQQTERPFEMGKHEAVVFCMIHQNVPLTVDEYMKQLSRADSFWKCPLCGFVAEWNDENYDIFIKSLEDEE
jgi:hypothetical protein